MTKNLKVLLVTGGYGSGTTAMAGALVTLGVPAFEPFFKTNDPLTPNSFETLSFREFLLSLIDEEELMLRSMSDAARVAHCSTYSAKLRAGQFGVIPDAGALPILLKAPAACLCVPYLHQVFDLRVVIVHRRFDAIERTRARRGWHHRFGMEGAKILYNKVLTDLVAHELSWLSVSYKDLVRAPAETLAKVVDYCGLEDLRTEIPTAARFIRQ